jgi:hypothetical protein
MLKIFHMNEIFFPNLIISLGEYYFYGFSKLTQIILPNSLIFLEILIFNTVKNYLKLFFQIHLLLLEIAVSLIA